jgi:hypothetical protein
VNCSLFVQALPAQPRGYRCVRALTQRLTAQKKQASMYRLALDPTEFMSLRE